LWVSAYLDAMLDLQRLADKYLRPIKPATDTEPADRPAAPVPARLAHHLLPRAPQPYAPPQAAQRGASKARPQ
jgi:hypothetical protein